MVHQRTSRRGVGLVMCATMALATVAGCGMGDDPVEEEVVTANGAYPAPVARATPGFKVALTALPLVVDNRLRVLDSESRVWAEPLEAPQGTSAYWSYDRDDTLLTVVQAQRAGGAPLVVSLWSDGAVIAIDARTGEVAWRAEGPDSVSGWSAFNHDVDGDTRLQVVPADGHPVLLVSAGLDSVLAFDATKGGKLWERKWTCDGSGTNWAAGHAVVLKEACEKGVRLLDPRSGEQTADSAQVPGLREVDTPEKHGCVQDVCNLLGARPDPNSVPRYWWIDEHGKPVPLAKGEPRPDTQGLPPVDVSVGSGSGTFALYATSPVDQSNRWSVEEPLNDAGKETFRQAGVTSDAVWVSSDYWHHDGPALLQYDPKTGKRVGCYEPPTGPIRDMATAGDYVVVNDATGGAEEEPEVTLKSHPFVMMHPDHHKSTC